MRNEELMKKWGAILEHNSLPEITDPLRKSVTAVVLENTQAAIQNGEVYTPASLLSEAAPQNSTGNVDNYDPVLISLVRRAMPNLIAYDIAGVQPMTGPTGLIFAMLTNIHENANNLAKSETFYNEVKTGVDGSGTGPHTGSPLVSDHANTTLWSTGTGLTTAAAEALGSGDSGDGDFTEMSFQIDKVSVTAKSRALKAEYTTELAQDLKAIHGLDAETELANILQSEILVEINRELVRTIYTNAVQGAAGTASAGTFDL